MLRSDFDSHPLWGVVDQVDAKVDQLIEQHVPDELPAFERIKTQMTYVRSFDSVASTRAAFFHHQMLDEVQTRWTSVLAMLDQRLARGAAYAQHSKDAADQAELALIDMAAWPRAYGKGGEVSQLNTLFEDLLEAQRQSIDALAAEHEGLRDEVRNFSREVGERRKEVIDEVDEQAGRVEQLKNEAEAQKAEVSDAVAKATRDVDALDEKSQDNFDAWAKKKEEDFERTFEPLRKSIEERTQAAETEYSQLLGAKDKYSKLVGAIAADEVASEFNSEARWGRGVGITFYAVGFGLLAAAAIPLVLLMLSPSAGSGVNWTAVASRLAIGVLAGSAATVAIRLGSRLVNNANAIRRMELEPRAIGPFLANVDAKPKVDDAFLELVNKAFGNTYAATKSTGGTDQGDDRVDVEGIARLLEQVDKLRRVEGSAPASGA